MGISCGVEIPTTWDLSDIVSAPDASCVYELFGVVNHIGSLMGGHYTAHCLVTPADDDGSRSSEGDWYKFDDSRVSRASIKDIDPEAVYIAFYRRVAHSRHRRYDRDQR